MRSIEGKKGSESREEDKHQENFRNLQKQVEELALFVEKQSEQIEQLNGIVRNIEDKVNKPNK